MESRSGAGAYGAIYQTLRGACPVQVVREQLTTRPFFLGNVARSTYSCLGDMNYGHRGGREVCMGEMPMAYFVLLILFGDKVRQRPWVICHYYGRDLD